MTGRVLAGLALVGLAWVGIDGLGLLVDLGREAGMPAELAGGLPGNFPFANQRELWLFALQAGLVLPGLVLVGGLGGAGEAGPGEGAWSRVGRGVRAPGFPYLMAAVAAGLVAWLDTRVLEHRPLTDDEHAYRIQAGILARGRLALACPPDPALWRTTYVFVEPERDRYFTKYPLGWPALLAPAAAAGAMPLALPLLAAVLVLAVDRVGRKLFPDSAVAPLVTAAFALSPMVLATGATLASQPASLFFLLIAMGCGLDEGEGKAGMAGLALGCALHTRPLSAAAAGLALVGWLASRPGGIRRAVAVGMGALPLTLAFLLFNANATGSAWVTPMERWDPLESYGFANSPDPRFRHTPARAAAVTATNLVRMEAWLTGWPGVMLLALAGMAGAAVAAEGLLTAWVLVHVLLHAGYFFPGVGITGPIYWYELGPPLLWLAARGAARVGVGPWFLVGALVYGGAVVAPGRVAQLGKLAATSGAPYAALARPGARPAVVALDFAPGELPGWKLGLSVVHPDLVGPGEPVLVRADAGPEALARLLARRGEDRLLVLSGAAASPRAWTWRPGQEWSRGR